MSRKKKTNLFLIAFYSIALLLISYFLLRDTVTKGRNMDDKKAATVLKPKLNEFGIPIDSVTVANGVIKPNETLSDLLSQYNLPSDKFSQINFIDKNIFDVRKIVSGKAYYAYSGIDSTDELEYFVYEESPVDYAVLDFRDSLKVYTGKKEVIVKRKTASGIINHSLYVALTKQDVDPELVDKLAEIYAWQVDFYHIQKGDRFKVIYEEKYVDNQPVGIGNILGACFNYHGEDFYAIPFDDGDGGQFYDENGKSLRKAFLKAPLKFSHITSRYSMHRYHPIEHRIKPHLGTDFAAPTGTPIHSTGDGVVTEATYSRFNGNFVKIRHNSVYSTQYLHMSKIAAGIHPGVAVKQGQVIGYVGMTGEATGPHVCYRFWKNGMQVDPFKQKFPASKPIDEEYLSQFDSTKGLIVGELDTIHFNDEQIANKLENTKSSANSNF